MQERYLGDDKDHVKFALLRHFHRDLGVRVAVNWYLTDPKGVGDAKNNDGNRRYKAGGNPWLDIDSELCARLQVFESMERRNIATIEQLEILPPTTRYVTERVPTEGRNDWHERARQHLMASDLVFLDPDNGLDVMSMSRSSAPKYALSSEVVSYVRAGQITVVIQFSKRAKIKDQVQDIRKRLQGELGGPVSGIPVIRCRLTPNILFFTFAPSAVARGIARSLDAFVNASPVRYRFPNERICQIVN